MPVVTRSWWALALAACLGTAGCAAAPAHSQAHHQRNSTGPAGSAPAPDPGSAPLPGGAPDAGRTRPAQNWPMYHRDPARTGAAPARPRAGRLAIAWRRRLDGAVYGQPLALGTLVIAATEGGSVYALSRLSGKIRWRAHIAAPVPLSRLPCGDIGPLGVTGTPVYDATTGLVYAVAETTGYRHILAAIRARTGRVSFIRPIPTPDGHPRYDQQRAALAVDRGRVYVAFGGLDGDCGPYQGSVVGVPASGRGPLVSYRVPTAREGGIWAAGGPVVGAGGTIYVSVGNGAATKPPFDNSDSVTALSPRLRRTGIFAPTRWAADNASDLDLGSSSPALLQADGRILAVGKSGTGYLLNASHLGGVGGQLASGRVCPAFGGMAVLGTVVYVPCASGGMAAVNTSGTRVRVLWRGPAGAQGAPVTGGGAVWTANWNAGVLYELDPARGAVRSHISVGTSLPHFASPALSGHLILLGTMNGVVAVSGG
jgi:outer membrane protein assembly factor BamB